MRVILVGPPRDRARLRLQLEGTTVDVVGAVLSHAEARRSGIAFDAVMMAGPDSAGGDEDDFAGSADAPFVEPLTSRETEVLGLMAEGLPNKAIADQLGISDQTVKFHVSSIAGKLGATN